MTNNYTKIILKNFSNSAYIYKKNAIIQRYFAELLAKECHKYCIPPGCWLDLGSGTGMLAEEIEKLHPYQKVIRIDGSQMMLKMNSLNSKTYLWDLNKGLPNCFEHPNLIASSFVLHWLDNPCNQLNYWVQALHTGGWLALCVPINGSFPEWYIASNKANVPYSAINLPSQNEIYKAIDKSTIKTNIIHSYKQTEKKAINLLKPIVKAGAHATQQKLLKTSQLRKLIINWPESNLNKEYSLTWQILILVIKQ